MCGAIATCVWHLLIWTFLGNSIVDPVDNTALASFVVIPVNAILKISAALTASNLLVEDRNRKYGADGTCWCGGEVLLVDGD